MKYNTDTVIVGTGVSGCFAALNLPEDMKDSADHKVRFGKQ